MSLFVTVITAVIAAMARIAQPAGEVARKVSISPVADRVSAASPLNAVPSFVVAAADLDCVLDNNSVLKERSKLCAICCFNSLLRPEPDNLSASSKADRFLKVFSK